MKRFFLILALAAPMIAVAQPKNVQAAKAAVDKAIANTEKKGDKPASWMALSDAYVNAYDVPTKDILPNSQKMENDLLLRGQKILKNETREGVDGVYSVDVFEDKDLYYNNSGILEFWLVTKPVLDGDLLIKANEALEKAFKMDPKAEKNSKYKEKAESIHEKYFNQGFASYQSGNVAKASKEFEVTSAIAAGPILNRLDTVSTYYSAMMAAQAGNYDGAIPMFNKCIEAGFTSGGNIFANLADAYKQTNNPEMHKKTLEDGFAKYPENQAILVSLINLYLDTNENPDKLFDLLHIAQANEPNNASLVYVEGDVYKKLGNKEKAVEFFRKSTQLDPNYVFGVLNIGILYYDNAVDLQEAANSENDDAKYQEIIDKLNQSLEMAIEPFEESFNMTKDPEIQMAVAEYLKNIYFRFREKGDDYKAKYEKYNNFVKGE